VEIGGQNADREFITARLELLPKTRLCVEQGFHSLAYIHAARPPEKRIGLHCPRLGEATIIHPHEWGNIQVEGKEILLVGWLSREEYRRKGKVLNPGIHTFQYEHTRLKNLLVPMEELNPLVPLFKRVKEWKTSGH